MKLIESMLYEIFNHKHLTYKYSRSFQNIKNVIELEHENGFKLPKNIIEKYERLHIQYDNFLKEIPLVIIEQYFYKHQERLNKEVFLMYQDKELSELKMIDLFLKFEDYYNEIFSLASLIANYYNIEIKINRNFNKETTTLA